jgi:predicted ATP-dependent serine protease
MGGDGPSGDADRLLVGREAELSALASSLSAACSGSARIVLVDGRPGIGTSALLRALLPEARGMQVLDASGDAPPEAARSPALHSRARRLHR